VENILANFLGLLLGSIILWVILNWDINRRYKKDIARDLENWEREIKNREEMWEIIRKLEKEYKKLK
jgi:hypothetical protein